MKIVPLSAVCKFDPLKAEARSKLMSDAVVAFVPMSDLGIDTKVLSPIQTRSMGDVVKAYTYFSDNDLLIAKITPCFENGKMGLARNLSNGVGFGSSEFTVIRASKEILGEYLYYFLRRREVISDGAKIMRGSVGHKRVPKEYLENLLIPLPSLVEQKAIVKKLDTAFAEIDKLELVAAKRESLLMKLEDQFLSSRFLTPAGPSSQLGDVANIRTGPFGSILHKSDYVGSGVPIINPTNLVDGEIEPSKCVSSEFAMKLSSYQVEEGDIVMGRRGDLGRCAVVKAEQTGWLCGTGSFVIRTNQRVRPRFLALVLSANKTREALTAISTGATMENLNNRELSKLSIWIPSIAEQEETLRLWDLLAAQIVEMKKSHMVKSRRLIQLRQSILSDSFSGESYVA